QIMFRPSFVSQSAAGTAPVSLSGYTFFPMLRMFPLENKFMKFMLQVGVGYGNLSGTSNNDTGSSVSFSGGTFGAMAGLGAEFCFTAKHCMSLAGNTRYLPIPRNIVSSASGSMGGSIGTPTAGGEL